MRVATLNIRYGTANDGEFAWLHRRQSLLNLLHDLDPDILCLQEALSFQIAEIAGVLPRHEWVGVGRDDGKLAGEYAPIFFKNEQPESFGTFWLSPVQNAPGTPGWGARHNRICTWARFPGLTVANVHLDHEAKQAREEGVRIVLSRIEGAALLCGDFNAEPVEPFFQHIQAEGFEDLAEGTGATYNGFNKEPQARIDYIFARGIVAHSATVIREPMVSDHWPVVVEINRPGG